VTRQTDHGAEFFEDPSRWLPERDDEVFDKLAELMDHVVTEINNQVELREEAAAEDSSLPTFDAKIAFKNQTSIRTMEKATLSVTNVLARRVDDFLFDVPPAR
jgi:hypothetical protein